MKGLLVLVALIAIALAGFFGFRANQVSKSQSEGAQKTEQLTADLEKARARELELQRKADQEVQARTMAEQAARKNAEAEARRLAQAQAEREAQETARKRAEEDAAKAAQALERIKSERERLEADAKGFQQLRAKDAAAADQKLAEAKSALQATLNEKNAEIQRQAALIAEYTQKAGTGPMRTDSSVQGVSSGGSSASVASSSSSSSSRSSTSLASTSAPEITPGVGARIFYSPAFYKRAAHRYFNLEREQEQAANTP